MKARKGSWKFQLQETLLIPYCGKCTNGSTFFKWERTGSPESQLRETPVPPIPWKIYKFISTGLFFFWQQKESKSIFVRTERKANNELDGLPRHVFVTFVTCTRKTWTLVAFGALQKKRREGEKHASYVQGRLCRWQWGMSGQCTDQGRGDSVCKQQQLGQWGCNSHVERSTVYNK